MGRPDSRSSLESQSLYRRGHGVARVRPCLGVHQRQASRAHKSRSRCVGKSNAGTTLRSPWSKQCTTYCALGEVMNIKKLPVAFLVGGLVIKTLLVLLWRQWGSGGLLSLLIDYDPGARYFAERMTRLFFDYRGITF